MRAPKDHRAVRSCTVRASELMGKWVRDTTPKERRSDTPKMKSWPPNNNVPQLCPC